MDSCEDLTIESSPFGLGSLIARSRFHQDDREIGFLKVFSLGVEICSDIRITRKFCKKIKECPVILVKTATFESEKCPVDVKNKLHIL